MSFDILKMVFPFYPDCERPHKVLTKWKVLTKVFYDWSKLNAPKLDTKTPKNQQVEKTGNVYPQPRHSATLGVLGYPMNGMLYTVT